MMRRSIAVTLIVAMTWMSTWAAAPGWAQEPSRPEPNFEEAMARLDSFMSIVKEIRAGIDRGRFDLDALIEELDYDDGEIVRFVTEEIHFEPYQGLLRGARGTLMSGSGNSLDQAVLLATLLKDAGYEARISRGELSRKQAERLLMTAASPRSARASPAIPLEVRKQLERMSELTGTSLNSIGAVSTDSKAQLPVTTAGEIDVKIEATGDALLASLEDAGIILAPRDTHQELVSDTTEYFWVDYRTGPATPWTSCHAAFGATQDSLVPPDPTQTFTTSVPPEFQHRVRLELFLEQEALGKKTTHTLMDPWERPAANMHGRTISLHFMPSTVVGPGGLASSLRDPESFGVLTPMVNNVLPSGAMAFNSRGFLVDPSVTESAAAGVFGEVGNAFGDAAGALSGLGSTKDTHSETGIRISAVWAQFTLIAPGGAEKSIKRSLFSRSTIGNKLPDASEGDRSPVSELALASRAFAVSTGLVPDLFLLDRTLEEIVRSKNTLEFIYKIKYLGDEFVDWPESSGSEPVSLLSLMSRLDSSPANSGKAVVFRHEPCLVYMEEVVADAGPALTGRVLVDILSNARRGVTKLNDRLVLEPEQVFRAGVWDTFAEAVDVEPEYSGAVVALNAADVFTSAQQKGDGLRVLRDGDTENLQALNIEGPTYKAIVGDLKAGFAVVVPSSLKESPDPVSTWWRVDPRTGECLGRILDGRGGVLKEYLITWATSFVVATTACLLVYAAVRGAIARQEKGEVEIKDAVKPRDFLRCAAFGVSVATFRANAAAPTHGLKLIGDKLVYVHYGIVTAETGALGIGVGFILVAMNTFLVPEDW